MGLSALKGYDKLPFIISFVYCFISYMGYTASNAGMIADLRKMLIEAVLPYVEIRGVIEAKE